MIIGVSCRVAVGLQLFGALFGQLVRLDAPIDVGQFGEQRAFLVEQFGVRVGGCLLNGVLLFAPALDGTGAVVKVIVAVRVGVLDLALARFWW